MRFPSRRCMIHRCAGQVFPRAQGKREGERTSGCALLAWARSRESRNTWINAFSRRRWRVSVIRPEVTLFSAYSLSRAIPLVSARQRIRIGLLYARDIIQFVAVRCCESDLMTFASRVTLLVENEIAAWYGTVKQAFLHQSRDVQLIDFDTRQRRVIGWACFSHVVSSTDFHGCAIRGKSKGR